MITIVDYGMGNLGSLVNMLKYIGVAVTVARTEVEIFAAERLILPGVGAFDTAMEQIARKKLRAALDDAALVRRIPVLGICLGMQLMTSGSEEGQMEGLNWIPGATRKFQASPGTPVPHMGWNQVIPAGAGTQLAAGLGQDSRFYFVHSYYVQVKDRRDVMLSTRYILDFDSGIARENIYGVQFHPEKSHKFGMKLLANFAEI